MHHNAQSHNGLRVMMIAGTKDEASNLILGIKADTLLLEV